MTTREEASGILRRVGGSDDAAIDIGEAALALAALDRPGIAIERYREHLAQIAREAGELAGEGAAARLTALNEVIAGRYGYAGDRETYDELQNANLMRVIDRRRGLPVALGIVWLAAARTLGWPMAGLNFPGHFLLRIDGGGERLMFDPFAGGRTADVTELRRLLKATAGDGAELRPEHWSPASRREVLLRLQNNIKLRLLKAGDVGRGLATVETMLLFAPGEARLWYEAAMLNRKLGNLRAAIVAVEHWQDLAEGAARHEAAALLQDLRARLN
ncbi:MAG: tetratricopeptide repeat protein [Alphaproteobacteria bacterium]|nr:tetratricopeptide repeat protein [Alphaproteobacteria bacterium]